MKRGSRVGVALSGFVDGREMIQKMRKSLGDKRQFLPDATIDEFVTLYDDLPKNPRAKVLRIRRSGSSA
ncbi:hypothetical protein [Salana multivorans]|uniref:hypothetical protein n=1 Tax=Salana multivorans TaxID=120377 RepID=UPI000F4BF1EB|nr:hypothetical protein [Salana multivorans]